MALQKKNEAKKKYAVYTRKSRFTGKGESIDHQKSQCIKKIFDTQENVTKDDIVFFEDEGFSGKNIKRPGFLKLKEKIENGEIAAVYVYSLDRLSRSISDFSTFYKLLKEKNVNFITVNVTFDTSTVSGETMLNMLSVFAEFERNLIAERIRDNMHELAKSGRWLGGTAPTGYISKEIEGSHTIDGKVRKAFMLEPVEDEITTIKVIFDKYIEYVSQSKLITYLMNEGYRTKNNVYFSRLAVKAILTNPVYVAADEKIYEYFSTLGANICAPKEEFNGKFGIMAYNKTVQIDGKANKKKDYSDWIIAIGKHKPVVISDEWLKVQEILEFRGKTTKMYPRTEIALLSGLLYCGNCGSHMRPKLGSVRNDGSKQLAYRCVIKEDSRKQLCDIRNIDGYEVDNIVLQQIFDLSEKLKTNTVDISTLRKTIEKSDIDYDAEIKKCEKKIADKNKHIKNATFQLPSYDINDPTEAAMAENLKIQIKGLITEKTALEAKLKNLQTEKDKLHQHYSDLDGFADSLSSFTEDYPNMSYDDRLKAIRSIVDFVIYHEDTDSVEVVFKGSDISKDEYLSTIKPTGMDSK